MSTLFSWTRRASQADPQDLITCVVSSCKGQGVQSVEKPADEEPSGHRFVAWVVRHLNGIYDRPIPAVDLTGVFRVPEWKDGFDNARHERSVGCRRSPASACSAGKHTRRG